MAQAKKQTLDISAQSEVGTAASSEIRFRKEREEQARLRAKVEKRKQDFRLYLEQTGIIDKLSKALLRMFEEPSLPEDPISYFKKLIVTEDFNPEVEELDQLSREVKELKAEIAGLTEENKQLRAALGMPIEMMPSPTVKITPSESEPPSGFGVTKDKPTGSLIPIKTASANLKDRKKKPN